MLSSQQGKHLFYCIKTVTMKLNLLTLLFLITLFSCGKRNVYRSEDFDSKSYQHQTIAILPFQISQTGYKQKNTSDEAIKASNEKWGYTFQERLQAYLLKYTGQNRKGPLISFQSTQKTNAILAEKEIDIATLYRQKPEDLAKLLGVDAVLMTSLENEKQFSDNVAYGLAAGRKILSVVGQGDKAGILFHNSSDIDMNTALYDAEDSKVLWQTFKKGGTDLPNKVDDLVEYYSSWIAKRFPYKS